MSIIRLLILNTLGSYSTIAWVSPLIENPGEGDPRCETTERTVFTVLNALGQMAFAYAGHNVVLEIQATIPSTRDRPSKKPMWRGVTLAYIIVAACYFPVALVGWKYLGNKVTDNVLLSLESPRTLIAIANMMVVIHVLGSYQVCGETSFSNNLYSKCCLTIDLNRVRILINGFCFEQHLRCSYMRCPCMT